METTGIIGVLWGLSRDNLLNPRSETIEPIAGLLLRNLN